MKRLLSCYASDFEKMSATDLVTAIRASEGRTILAETVVTAAPLLEGVTNAEVMAAFGADMICLNEFDVYEKDIVGMAKMDNPIAEIKRLIGRPVGINLEPVNEATEVLDVKVHLSEGRKTHVDTFKAANDLGIDFILITGNPSTGVTNASILEAISLAKAHFNGVVFAGKMHGAGVAEKLIDLDNMLAYIKAGADGVLVPSVGTVPGVTVEEAREATLLVQENGGLVMGTIGTSQESADEATIRQIGLYNKQVGVDVHHIGDGGYGRMPIPENITQLSLTVRGKRHTYFRMAQSVRR